MKTLAVRFSVAFILALTLFTASPMWGQGSEFKAGDSVEIMVNGKWEPGSVTGRSGCGGTCGGYYVAQGTFSWFANDGPATIRAHTMTAAQQSEADKTAAVLAARAKSGNGIGAQYGVREPATCNSRTAAPATAAIAKQYVMCGMEGFDGVDSVILLSDVTVQVGGSHAFNYAMDAPDTRPDLKAQVYDLQGSFKEYQCTKPRTDGGAYLATHNCMLYDQPVARGTCYRDTSGNWHCSLMGNRLASTGVAGQMAPR